METASTSTTTSSSNSNTAFSLISKGWREVRNSADADLQLMRARANSFKNLANSFDRELENFFNSSPTEIDFVKKLQPKISEIRRVYSAPEISKKVFSNWRANARLGIDLSAIRNAIVVEEEEEERGGVVEFGKRGRVGFREFWGDWKEEGGQFGKWEPIRVLKRRLKQFEKKSEFGELFGGFKNSELVEKVKSGLVCV